jgi:enamine deaminase RidA (YjgF/YER057c/UK114 family)
MREDAAERNPQALKVHILDELYHHSSNVAHGVEVPAGARLLFTNGQVGTRRDGTTPQTTAEQAKVVFTRVEAVLAAANMALSDVVRLTVFLTDPGDVGTFVEARDRVMGDHKPGAIILVVKALARSELKIEIEAIAARVD